MKKFLLICILLISSPVYSLCPIDSNGESVCSISGNQNNSLPIFQNPNAGININNPQKISKPLQQESKLNNPLPATNNSIMQYNSGCQFGTCVQDLNNIKNQNQ